MSRDRLPLRFMIAAAIGLLCGCSTMHERASTATGYNESAGAGSANTPAAPSMAAAIADVQQLGLEDPQAQQALLEEMKKTDPSLWPQLVQVFRSSMAYHRQSAARLAAARGDN